MRHSLFILKDQCAFCLWLALLITGGFGSCASGNWQILTQGGGLHSSGIDSISFTDSQHGWALTAFQLLETNDGGKTWTARLESEDGKMAFYSFEFVSPTTGFIVGVQRKGEGRATLILQTNDGGRSWQESPFNVSSPDAKGSLQLNSVSFCNSQVGWAVGPDLIVHTADGGQTWETQRSSNNEEVLFGVACVSPKRAWAVGTDGLILQTADGGQTWHRQNSGSTDALVRVRFFGDSGWIVGGLDGKGTLLRTRGDGATWERISLESFEGLTDIFMNGQQGWIAGTNGTILYTNDGGLTWQREISPTENDLVSLFFLNPQQGWIGGDKRTILRLAN